MSPSEEIAELEEEIALLRRALAFYANRDHWQSPAEEDSGDIAQIALGELPEDE